MLTGPDYWIEIALTERISANLFGESGMLEQIDEKTLPNLRYTPQR